MTKKVTMWLTFFVFFLAGMIGSYTFINRDNENLTIEASTPGLPLICMHWGDYAVNTLYGFTGNMLAQEAARDVIPVDESREISCSILASDHKLEQISYEVRNSDGSRLIENGTAAWKQLPTGEIQFTVQVKDLIEEGGTYLFVILLDTESVSGIRYYTRFIYGEEYDIANQLKFVEGFHENTFDAAKTSEIAQYMETDPKAENTSLGYVDIYSATSQVMWKELDIEPVTEPEISITYLQDGYGGYELDYYAESTLEEEVQYYHVVEDYLVSTVGEQLYLIDFERHVSTIFQSESDVYESNEIFLGIQQEEIPVVESEDGNMAAFVVNSSLYYYDDNDNQMNLVYGLKSDELLQWRNDYFDNDMKVLHVDESGSMYFIMYGYMNRGEYEGRTGIALYYYDGLTKMVQELAFYESSHSPEFVMAEAEKLSFLSRQQIIYLCIEGNIVSYDISTGETKLEQAYDPDTVMYAAEDGSSLVFSGDDKIRYLYLETGTSHDITASAGERIIPQGFIGNDFVYGIADEGASVLQSDGSYAPYMKALLIEDALGSIVKRYESDGVLITSCEIQGTQILIDRVYANGAAYAPASQDQILSSKSDTGGYNSSIKKTQGAYQTVTLISLKNKINLDTLQHIQAKEIFFEQHQPVDMDLDETEGYCAYYDPWGISGFTTDAGEAMVLADARNGYAYDENGILIWKRIGTNKRNQIMAIELEKESAERDSKTICMDLMLRQAGSPKAVEDALAQGSTCQDILTIAGGDYRLIDITGCTVSGLLYYVDQDIPVMVLYEDGEAVLITGFNQFNIVVMDPHKGTMGYMSRSDAEEMLEQTNNQVFTYYYGKAN